MNSLKVEADSVVTPSGSDNGGIGTKLEGNDVKQLAYGSASAKSVTLSFWVRSNKTGIYCCQFQTNQGSGNSDQYSHVKEYTISSANTWEKKTLTFSGLTAAAITSTTTDGLRVIWWLACGPSDHVAADTWTATASYEATSNQVNFMDSASNEWYLTGCQLEVGTEATPFEQRSSGQELALCQRYYQEIYMFHDGGSSYLRETIPFKTNMRSAPAAAVFSEKPDGTGTNTSGKIYQGGGETSAAVSNQNISSARLDSNGYTANVDIYGRVTLDSEL